MSFIYATCKPPTKNSEGYQRCYTLELEPSDAAAYNNRGNAYSDLGEYNSAIADYTTAIRLVPDYAKAYNNRRIAKENAGLPYCSDYKKACELGAKECCEWYDDQYR